MISTKLSTFIFRHLPELCPSVLQYRHLVILVRVLVFGLVLYAVRRSDDKSNQFSKRWFGSYWASLGWTDWFVGFGFSSGPIRMVFMLFDPLMTKAINFLRNGSGPIGRP